MKILNFFLILLWTSAIYAVENTKSLTAKSWLVADGSGSIIQSYNIDEVRSIASITKLMTAMVVIDSGQDLTELILFPKYNKKYHTRDELITYVIVRSDNQAAELLCQKYPNGYKFCIDAMNRKASELGMNSTRFYDATGLDYKNVSTARELISLVLSASQYPQIIVASRTSEIKIQIKKKWLIFPNTNPIIGKRHEFIVSKTGWITASGGCIVMLLQTDVGLRTVVVLGSKNTTTRIPEAEFIARSASS